MLFGKNNKRKLNLKKKITENMTQEFYYRSLINSNLNPRKKTLNVDEVSNAN